MERFDINISRKLAKSIIKLPFISVHNSNELMKFKTIVWDVFVPIVGYMRYSGTLVPIMRPIPKISIHPKVYHHVFHWKPLVHVGLFLKLKMWNLMETGYQIYCSDYIRNKITQVIDQSTTNYPIQSKIGKILRKQIGIILLPKIKRTVYTMIESIDLDVFYFKDKKKIKGVRSIARKIGFGH